MFLNPHQPAVEKEAGLETKPKLFSFHSNTGQEIID
jgi:hypothetical protein